MTSPNTLADRVNGELYAARALSQFVFHLKNWRQVWSAYRLHQPIPSLVLRKGGATIAHGPGDDAIGLFREVFVDQVYTRGFYFPANSGQVVVDIGANIGFFALFVESRHLLPRIHCFEPAAQTRELLTRNVTDNHLERSISIHPFGVSDGTKIEHLHAAANSGHRSFIASEFVENTVEAVECISLAQALDRSDAPQIDLLKVDVEGAEVEIFGGADSQTLRRCRRVVVETHDRFRPGARDIVERTLRTSGFSTKLTHQWSELGIVQATNSN